jgi:hypothetical protein
MRRASGAVGGAGERAPGTGTVGALLARRTGWASGASAAAAAATLGWGWGGAGMETAERIDGAVPEQPIAAGNAKSSSSAATGRGCGIFIKTLRSKGTSLSHLPAR